MLKALEQHVKREEYRLALADIEKVRKKKMHIDERLRIEVLESRCWTGLGEFSKAFTIAQEVVDKGTRFQEYTAHVIKGLLEMASAAWGLGISDEILVACEQAERMRKGLQAEEQSTKDSIRAEILYHESLGWYLKDDVHKGIDCARESLSIRERLGDTEGVVSSLMRVGYLNLEVDPSRTLEYEEKALELNRQLGRKGHIIQSLLHRGLIESWEGNWVKAEQLLLQSIGLIREHDMGYWLLPCLGILGVLYGRMGDFQRSEEFYQECLTLAERVSAGLYIAICSMNLSEIHRTRGDLEEALKGYERAMNINKRVGRTKGYLTGLANCGLVQYARGQIDEALTLLEESLALAEKQKQAGLLGGYIISYDLLFIISILIDKGMISDAQQCLDQIRLVSEESKDDYDNQVYRIAKALVLKSSMLTRNKAKAKEILTKIVDGDFHHNELSVLALLHLTELMVNELQMTGDPDALSNLRSCLAKLLEMAAKQGSTLLLVETHLLQSKVALLNLEAERASLLLDEAQSLADQKGLTEISKRIVAEQEALANELSVLEELSGDETLMAKRAEKTRIHEHIGEMIQQGLWRKMLF
ncbi:MAG: tetratricopeptide repeat protein [Candidatus Thorarchaeota archaeon]